MKYLYKQIEGFKTRTYHIDKTIGVIPDEIKDDILEVDNETYHNLHDRKLMWQNGSLVDNPDYERYLAEMKAMRQVHTKEKRIKELKQLLADSDFRAIKYAEGYYSEEEFAPYKAQRQEWRDEINRLEEELNSNQ